MDNRLGVLRADPAAGIDRQTAQKPPRPTPPASRPPAQAWLGLAWLGLAWLGLAWLGKMVFIICDMSSVKLKFIDEANEGQSGCATVHQQWVGGIVGPPS